MKNDNFFNKKNRLISRDKEEFNESKREDLELIGIYNDKNIDANVKINFDCK